MYTRQVNETGLVPYMLTTCDVHTDLCYLHTLLDIAHDAGLPVIVHIHSGAYLLGSSRGQGPDILLNENVVLVTINYRLGPFGFLRLEGGEYSGNMGLKDQLLALKWVRNNARVFGGDPTLITVFGHSAGAAAVNMHVWSTASRPYFKRAVMSGAAAFVPWAYKRVNHTQMLTRTVAKQSGKVEEQVKLDEVVEWLQTVDANAIGMLDNRQLFIGGQRSKLIDFTWLPVVEGRQSIVIVRKKRSLIKKFHFPQMTTMSNHFSPSQHMNMRDRRTTSTHCSSSPMRKAFF